MKENMHNTSHSNTEEFSRLLIAAQPQVHSFIYSLVSDHEAAQDILQDVSTILWRKFSDFEQGTNFTAWAIKVSRFSVYEWRRKQKKNTHLPLDDQTFDLLAAESLTLAIKQEEQLESLRSCLTKLTGSMQEVIEARYQESISVQEIAIRLQRSRMTIYKMLKKAHCLLHECLELNTTKGLS